LPSVQYTKTSLFGCRCRSATHQPLASRFSTAAVHAECNSPHPRRLPWTHAFVATLLVSLHDTASSFARSQVRRAFNGAVGQDGPDNTQPARKRFWDSVPFRVRSGSGKSRTSPVGERGQTYGGCSCSDVQIC